MVITWNYGAIAQMEQSYGATIWNWSGPAGPDVVYSTRPYYVAAMGTAAPGPAAHGTAAPGSAALGKLED